MRRAARRWLWPAGALVGGALAVASVLAPPPRAPREDGAVATVNGRPILREDYERALASLAGATKDGRLDEAIRRHVLDRLVDQELLVQRAIELGLAERDPKVRLDLSGAVIDLLSARGGHLSEPGDDELRRFYRERRAWFAKASAARVRCWYVAPRAGESEADTKARAEQVATRLRQGLGVDGLAAPPHLPVPDALLPIAKLRDYLGGSAAKAVASLPQTGVAVVASAEGGYQVVQLTERRDTEPELFERARVLEAWRQDAGNRRLREFLAERRKRSRIVIDEVL